jgi:hypothetical protein
MRKIYTPFQNRTGNGLFTFFVILHAIRIYTRSVICGTGRAKNTVTFSCLAGGAYQDNNTSIEFTGIKSETFYGMRRQHIIHPGTMREQALYKLKQKTFEHII